MYICLLKQPTSSVKIFVYKYSVQFSKGTLSWLSIKKTELQTNFIPSVGQSFLLQYDTCKIKIKTTLTRALNLLTERKKYTHKTCQVTQQEHSRENNFCEVHTRTTVFAQKTRFCNLQHYAAISISTTFIAGGDWEWHSYRSLRVGRNDQNHPSQLFIMVMYIILGCFFLVVSQNGKLVY